LAWVHRQSYGLLQKMSFHVEMGEVRSDMVDLIRAGICDYEFMLLIVKLKASKLSVLSASLVNRMENIVPPLAVISLV
jgi:hypothetical protein